MKILYTISLTLLFSFTLIATQALAQDATVQAEGTVLTPLSVTGTNLNFGAEIFPGINEEVLRTDAAAAQFDIVGEAEKEITATFTLPDEMSDGTNSFPITFGTTDAGHSTTEDQGNATGYNPADVLTTPLNATGGTLFIWLGGTAEPAANQPAGIYSADITLETAYTGN